MAPDVRVVTFNAAAGNPRITTRQADFLQLPFYREALESVPGAPLLALQEVGDEQAAALRRTAAARAGRVLQMRRPKLGNALVIPDRYLVLSHRRNYYVVPQLRGILDGLRGRRPNWRQFGELRMWIEARLRDRHTGRDLTLLTTHISADGSLKVPQTKAIVGRALAAAARGPVILAGDFNVPAHNPRGRDVEAAALIARLRDVGTAKPPGRENIDYVLTAGFEPVSSRLWTGDSLSLPGSPNAETVSDHYAEDDVVRYS
ncbi:MAG TPA: endonuclease/exonuclease/phosphatase family protein [Solirubrobacteraceae bacterium]|nr:endonuclease/exonuclease/phosphatase family protein [Solirubrobacteraceae bacterium]